MQKFILIDGNAIIHRAYHALPPLTTKNGIVVNAVYGFFAMLLKVLEEEPSYVAVTFDRPAPSFRKSMYVGYQAQRPTGASDLGPQFGIIRDIVERMKIPVFAVDGYEADDVIGTISHLLTEHIQETKDEVEVIIVSGDRDLFQLINEHVKVLTPLTGMTKMDLYTEEKVEQKYGIKPKQIADYKGLIGDASDNYPGVTGIGPKTAAGLLLEYSTLEEIYENIALIPEKTATKLATDAEQAMLAKQLATILKDVPLTFDLEKCKRKYFDMKAARKIFEEYEFKSLVDRINN